MAIIIFLAVLGLLILSHEFGHFIVAKRAGVMVFEFAFGFPPKLFWKKFGETTYKFNLIPFGGYVKMLGEEGDHKEDPRSFASQPAKTKFAILSAGVVFNVMLAWVLITIGFTAGMPSFGLSSLEQAAKKSVVITAVSPDSPAEHAGIMVGDTLPDFITTDAVQSFVESAKGVATEFHYERGGEIIAVTITPRVNPPGGDGAIGIAMQEVSFAKFPFFIAIWKALKATFLLVGEIAVGIIFLIVGAIRGTVGFGSVLGPVGIGSAVGAAANLGFGYLLGFTAFLSLNLAILNLIPFPALDGGRIFFLAIEKLKGSPVSEKVSNYAHGIGFALLVAFMLVVTYKDILRVFG